MKKKALVSSILTIALCLSLITGSTFALFTSESKVNVAVTAGNVEVVATVEDIELTSTLGENLPETSADFIEGTNTVELVNIVPGDVVSFNIRVHNASNVTIAYRTVIKVVEDTGLWDGLQVTINGTEYTGAEKTSAYAVAAPSSEDIVVPVRIALPEDAGNEYKKTSCTFSYIVEAVQGNADFAAGIESLRELLAEGKEAFLMSDLTVESDEITSSGYGKTGINMVNGGTFDGNGNALTVNGAGGTWDSAIAVQGGTIKNLEVGGAFRGIFMSGATADVVIDQVVIDNVCYAFNSDAGNKNYSVTIKNSTLNGWTSYSDVHKYVAFENCKFGAGTGSYQYAYMRPYNATILTDCVFEENFEFDARQNNSIVFDNCYVGSTLITSENIVDLLGEDAANAIVLDNAEPSAAIESAIEKGASTITLGSGNYIIPDSAQGKTLTIIGNGVDTVVATQDDGSYEGCDYSLDGSTVTFEGITINTDSTTYTGYARLNATYNNCTINGTYTLYGDSIFNNCTFNVSGDVYNIWTWGAPNVTFNDCTFNSDGKAVLLYGTENTNMTVNGCIFNDNGGLTDLKAAIEIGNDYGKSYTLTVSNTVVNGYEINDKGISTNSTLWANKNSMSTENLNVVIDGVDVY